MRLRAAGLLALALDACAPVPPGGPGGLPRRPAPPAPSAPVPVATVEREVRRLLDEHRARAGLPALRHDERIAEIAREHSRAMATGTRPFGHDGFDDRAGATARVVAYRAFAENVAYDSRTGPELPGSLVTGWLGSPGHRRNIEGSFTATGIGAARSPGGVTYATQLFVRE